MASKPDYEGWATKFGVKCTDGRTIRKGAFSAQDGSRVPFVFQHNHKDVDNVLGHAILEDRDEGVWAYLYLNGTPKAEVARKCIEHGDLDQLSIWANSLTQTPNGDVLHGVIRELSLVLSGANSGARIEFPTMVHSGETTYDEAIIWSGEYIQHSSDSDKKEEEKKDDEKKDDSSEEEMDLKQVIDSMTDKQKDALYTVVGSVLASVSGGSEAKKDAHAASSMESDNKHDNGGSKMQYNVFDRGTIVGARRIKTTTDGTLAHDSMGDIVRVEDVLSHDQMATIFADAKRGSLKDAFLAHAAEYGIENIEYLFPDARTLQSAPDFISRDMGWVQEVMNSTHHSPFSRIKSVHADITEDEARARGYIKGKLKKEEVFTLLRRTTTPQTIYKKQKLDKDDIIDITDFDVVAWIKTEMRMMLNEEIARAILIGDGRSPASEDKIQETNVRPIYKDTDSDLYAMRSVVTVGADASEDDIAKAFIRQAIKSRKNYKGSGKPTLFTTEDMLTSMLLLEDGIGHSLYKTEDELSTKLRVRKIVTVPVMENVVRTEGEAGPTQKTYPLLGIIVNLTDYNVGADKGGSVNMFDDFDIDYNQYKYLIETRISGALTRPKSAIVLELSSTEATKVSIGAPGLSGDGVSED